MKHLFYSVLLAAILAAVSCDPIDPDPVDPIEEPEPEIKQDTLAADSALPTIGDFRYLVILVETSDIHFSIPTPNQAFWDMLNKKGYSDYGATGSARDYFIDQSMSAFTPTFDVEGPVVIDTPMSKFTADRGLTKLGAARLFAMACEKIDPDVDFSIYDTDHNGYIDNVFFYYAGYNSADGPDDLIWPHAGKVEYKQWTFDGVRLSNYACTSELKGDSGTNMARIGNFCHEFAHILGLPDLYDTNSGKADGIGDFSLMHSGCYNNNGNTPPSMNCEERLLLGWLKEIPSLKRSEGHFTLGPISGNSAYRSETDNDGEYFCYEYRDGKGWDAYIPQGIVIYHVDKSENDVNGKTASFRWRHLYDLNGFAAHECFDLVKASDDYTPFGKNVRIFSPTAWDGNQLDYKLSGISFDGSCASFNIESAQ